MKKFSVILAILVIGIMVASAAQAQTTPPLGSQYNSIFFTNDEEFININNVGGLPNRLDVGDQFWGLLDTFGIKNPSTSTGSGGLPIWGFNNPTYAPPLEISAYFAIEVKSVFYLPALNPALPDITVFMFGALATGTDPNGVLTLPNEVMRVFTSDAVYNYDASTKAGGLANVLDGTHVWSMGFNYDEPVGFPGSAGGADGWYYSTFPGNTREINAGDPGGLGYGGLNFLPGSPHIPVHQNICDPNDIFYNPACTGNLGDPGLLVSLFFNSEQINEHTPDGIGTADGTPFDVFSQDPAVIYTHIPEPATMLLLGTGLMGLAGASRRRRKAAKK